MEPPPNSATVWVQETFRQGKQWMGQYYLFVWLGIFGLALFLIFRPHLERWLDNAKRRRLRGAWVATPGVPLQAKDPNIALSRVALINRTLEAAPERQHELARLERERLLKEKERQQERDRLKLEQASQFSPLAGFSSGSNYRPSRTMRNCGKKAG